MLSFRTRENGSIAAMLCIAGLAGLVAPLWFVGCTPGDANSTTSGAKASSQPAASLTLQLLVVNEPELAERIKKLRGEWEDLGVGDLQVVAAEWNELTESQPLDADVVIFPSRFMGELCAQSRLRPIRDRLLQSRALKAGDFFPIVGRDLIRWGGEVVALPLAVKPYTSNNGDAPRPALSLLAKAAPSVVIAERLGTLFDPETMKPRIAEPEFVASLKQLAAQSTAANQPTNGGVSTGEAASAAGERSVSEPPVPVLGYADRLAAVTTSSRNGASAFKLLEWLALADTSSRLADSADDLSPARRSQASSSRWYPDELSADERGKLAQSLSQLLDAQHCLMIPRIPAAAEYLSVLDEAVNAATTGNVQPQTALETTSNRWEEITEAHGRDKQRSAYQKHLGIVN